MNSVQVVPLDYRVPLQQDKIRQLLDIPKQIYTDNYLIRGILELLKDEKYVEHDGYGSWKIREKGIAVIEGST